MKIQKTKRLITILMLQFFFFSSTNVWSLALPGMHVREVSKDMQKEAKEKLKLSNLEENVAVYRDLNEKRQIDLDNALAKQLQIEEEQKFKLQQDWEQFFRDILKLNIDEKKRIQ